jgi:hypothetical protein
MLQIKQIKTKELVPILPQKRITITETTLRQRATIVIQLQNLILATEVTIQEVINQVVGADHQEAQTEEV